MNHPVFRWLLTLIILFFGIGQVENTPLLKFERYTLQQRIEIIKIHYKNDEQLAVTVRKTKAFLGRREAPCRTAIQKLVEKFELLGQVSDVKNKPRARRSRTTENIAKVAQSVEQNPGWVSISRRSLEVGRSLVVYCDSDREGLNHRVSPLKR